MKKQTSKQLSHDCIRSYCIIHPKKVFILHTFLKYFYKGRYSASLTMDKKVYSYVYNTEKCNKHFFLPIIFLRIFPLDIKKYFKN